MDFESFLDAYGLIAIFGVMLLKSVGVPIPIPADALMLATSARVASGRMGLAAAFLALLLALTVGGIVQFRLVGGPGRGLVDRFGSRLGITPKRLEFAAGRMQKGGVVGVALAILTPGIRSVAVIACGLTRIPVAIFAPGLLLGSALFLALHFFLGYIGGAILINLGAVVSPPMLIGGIVVLLALGFGVWVIIRRRQHPDAPLSEVVADAVGAWHEAVCPACLALGAVRRLQIDLPIEHAHLHQHAHS